MYWNFRAIIDKTFKLQIQTCQLWHPLLISVLVNNQRLWRRAKTTITIIIIMTRKKKVVQILQNRDLRLKNSHNRSNLSYNNNNKKSATKSINLHQTTKDNILFNDQSLSYIQAILHSCIKLQMFH